MTVVLSDLNGGLLQKKEKKKKKTYIVQYYIVLYYCNKNVNVKGQINNSEFWVLNSGISFTWPAGIPKNPIHDIVEMHEPINSISRLNEEFTNQQ